MTIHIILDRPQMGENIGAAARSMKNFGLSSLRIINPRDGWPNEKAIAMAAHAEDIIANTSIYGSVAEACSDLDLIFATSARLRQMSKSVVRPTEINDLAESHKNVGIIFGPERSGLDNHAVSIADYLIYIDTAEFSSLNLAQAVAIVCYALFRRETVTEICNSLEYAKAAEIENMLEFIINKLDTCGYFSAPEKKSGMVISIRNIFKGKNFTAQEIRTLYN